jgi:replicative DNA helicase
VLVPNELILNAKEKLGSEAAIIIANDLELKEFDSKNLRSLCPFHDEDTPSFIWNQKDNYFHCYGCNKIYGILDHYISFYKLTFLGAVQKLFEKTDIKFSFGEMGIKTKRDYKYPKYDLDENRDLVEKYFAQRKISKETLDYCDIQQGNGGLIIWNFYNENDVLLTVKCRHPRKPKKGEMKEWYLPEYDNTPILFNMNKIDPTQPLVITEGQCFPPETEILTEDGWVRFDQYQNQKVMAVDSNMQGEFVTPLAKIIKDYEGDLYNYHQRNYSAKMTPDHNIVYFDYKDRLQKKPISQMPNSLGENSHIPVTIFHDGAGIPLTNPELALFIAISADGSIDKRVNGRLFIRIAFKKQRKIDRFRTILQSVGIKFHEGVHASGKTCFCFNAPLWFETKLFNHKWISQSTLDQKKIIINEIVYWDGNFVPNRKQIEYSSNIYENAKFIQTIAHLCGFKSSIIIRPKGNYKPVFKVSILFSKNSVSWQNVYKNGHLTKENYKGKVYCVTVPTGMILTRFDGCITVTGNCDALSVIESGYKNVVSIPGGTENSKWIEICYEWLEKFEKIILWFDSDTSGINARKEASARLGNWRTLFVDMPYGEYEISGIKRPLKDANDILIAFGKEKIISLIENANEIPIENIIDLADVPDFDIETTPGLYSPFGELDKYINKFILGTVVVVTGRNGSGKSSLLNQMFIAESLNQGYDTFVYSAEMSKPILKNWLELVLMDRKYIELKNNTVHKFINKDAINEMRSWYKNRVFVYDDDKDLSANSILGKLEAVVRKFGVKIALLDNLLSIDLGTTNQDNLWQEQKKFMVRLINFANKFNILIVLVAHPRKTAELRRLTSDDVGGSGDITNLAHYVLSIHRYSKSEKEGEKDGKGNYKKGKEPIKYDCVLDLFKNRITGHANKSIDLYFDYLGYKFYKTPAQLWKRYKWNKDDSLLPNNDPNDHEEIPDDFKD